MNEADQRKYLEKAAHTLSNARPTTAKRMELVTSGALRYAHKAMDEGKDIAKAMFQSTIDSLNRRYSTMEIVGENLATLFPKKGTIMTQCFGETIVGMMLRAAKRQEKDIKIFVPETRPYFQGARLTASVAQGQGFDTTVITDNMPAFVMSTNKIDLFTSAADAICMDGYVVNKVGTYQIAIAAKYHGIPYFVTGVPDRVHDTIDTVTIEYRDPELVLEARGIKNTLEGVKGYYPSFDITPPHLVSGVVTDKGIFTPYDLDKYFESETEGFYSLTI